MSREGDLLRVFMHLTLYIGVIEMKLKYSAAVTVYRDYYIEVEAESYDEAFEKIRSMEPEELEEKAELYVIDIYKDTIYIRDRKAKEIFMADRKARAQVKKQRIDAHWDPIDEIYDKYRKMADVEIHARIDEITERQKENGSYYWKHRS
jgi:hypothetical protein